jgi:acyl-coenzyme A synthetase/AMP-(fatty) acid ligase
MIDGERFLGLLLSERKMSQRNKLWHGLRARQVSTNTLGGMDFVDQIMKSPSGKILRRIYRDLFKSDKGGVIKTKL